MTVPFTFANQNNPIPLSELDANFASVGITDNIEYTPPYTNSVAETLSNKLSQTVSVVDFGADSTGTIDSLSAFTNAVNNSNYIYVPSGTYKLNGQLVVSNNNVTILLAANATLELYGVAAEQTPVFGEQIHVTGNNFSLIGSGPSSVIQLINGTQAAALGSHLQSGFLVKDVYFDGGKSSVSDFTDDTFGNAINIISYSGGTSTAVIDGCTFTNFVNYAFNVYGPTCRGVKITNCNINNLGNSNANSVGCGIAITYGVSDIIVSNNTIHNNKAYGIFVCSGGASGYDFIVSNNNIYSNGDTGILFVEQPNFGGQGTNGSNGINISDNVVNNNNNHGICIATNSNIGQISWVSITGNICYSNNSRGIIIQSNPTPHSVYYVNITGNICNQNNIYGIEVDQYVQYCLVSNNIVLNNVTDQILTAAGQSGTNISVVNNYTNSIPPYYEGTFTPIITGSTSAGTGTYTVQDGKYTINGNVLNYQLSITWTAHTGTGNLQVSGFPLSSYNGNPQSYNYAIINGISVGGSPYLINNGGTTYGTMYVQNSGSQTILSMTTSGTITINGSYYLS